VNFKNQANQVVLTIVMNFYKNIDWKSVGRDNSTDQTESFGAPSS